MKKVSYVIIYKCICKSQKAEEKYKMVEGRRTLERGINPAGAVNANVRLRSCGIGPMTL